MATERAAVWGTWEELLLGGAVLRHGDADWDAVAGELRARTTFPHLFSPQACVAKFEELQERYSGGDAMFEELRKKRVIELKRELEKSEDSIGSLQAKLENLSSQRESGSNSVCHTNQTESPSTAEKACANDSFSKDTSKDGSSATSSDRKTRGDCCSTSHFVDSVSTKKNSLKLGLSGELKKQEGLIGELDHAHASFRKKRSKRKRRACTIVKEGSMGDSEMVISSTCIDVRPPSEKSCVSVSGEINNMDLRGLMDLIMEYKDFSAFQHRLEGQKKANYKKLIRQHIDFLIIRSRIGDGSISSNKELFRDLLLLSNNALVFFPKNSIEQKSALSLLELVKKTMRQNAESPACRSDGYCLSDSVAIDNSKKAISMHPCDRSFRRKPVVADEGAATPNLEVDKKASRAYVQVMSPAKNKGTGRPVKARQKGGRRQKESPNIGKKRVRRI